MTSMQDKRQALADLVKATLLALGHTYRVDVYLREAILNARYPSDRDKIMGDPVRYVVVFHAGMDYAQDDAHRSARGIPLQKDDTFLIQLRHGHDDGPVFDAIIDGPGSLLQTLVETVFIPDVESFLGIPQGVGLDVVALGGAGRAHYARFTITLTG